MWLVSNDFFFQTITSGMPLAISIEILLLYLPTDMLQNFVLVSLFHLVLFWWNFSRNSTLNSSRNSYDFLWVCLWFLRDFLKGFFLLSFACTSENIFKNFSSYSGYEPCRNLCLDSFSIFYGITPEIPSAIFTRILSGISDLFSLNPPVILLTIPTRSLLLVPPEILVGLLLGFLQIIFIFSSWWLYAPSGTWSAPLQFKCCSNTSTVFIWRIFFDYHCMNL